MNRRDIVTSISSIAILTVPYVAFASGAISNRKSKKNDGVVVSNLVIDARTHKIIVAFNGQETAVIKGSVGIYDNLQPMLEVYDKAFAEWPTHFQIGDQVVETRRPTYTVNKVSQVLTRVDITV